MKEIQKFLKAFFLLEADKLDKQIQPNIEAYNAVVDKLLNYISGGLRRTFGVKMTELDDVEYYERVKNYPPANPRHVFRIDKYRTIADNIIYICYVSRENPNKDWLTIADLFLVEEMEDNFQIISKFSDHQIRFMEVHGREEYVWIALGGSDRLEFEIPVENDEYAATLNWEFLGKPLETIRLLEPINDKRGIEVYHQS